ncbi:hypothetical protein [Sphingobacterium pedocola]|uniref:Uncharacterized protein n=1 Tax=Sphingobacterium pedocola TaxID=2082722 RepID=A0ABR9T5S8_9SPHI|nr:hypothetical protein [Sphingobacterium pedocola]MBE8720680.1 hypothetical protein [Sphingobacterium pedocola]
MKVKDRSLGWAGRFVLFFLLLLGLGKEDVCGQVKEYASSNSRGIRAWRQILGGAGEVSNPPSSIASVVTSGVIGQNFKADLKATTMTIPILNIGANGEGWVEFTFSEGISANTQIYIPFDLPTSTGVNLDLLNLVGGLLGLVESNIVNVAVYSGSNEITSDVHKDILKGLDNKFYFLVKSSTALNRVRFRLRFQTTLLGINLGSNLASTVYDAFYYSEVTACSLPLSTDLGRTMGISINLGDVVKNPLYAIDVNTSSYSEISTGALAVTASAVQNIYFPALSETTSTLKLRLGITSSGLNLDLLGAYRVRVFNGSVLVQSFTLQAGLVNGLDLVGLLGNGGATTVSFPVTNGAYDRVEIGLNTTVGLNLAASTLRIYNVTRNSFVCPEPPPTAGLLINPVCVNTNIVSSEYVDDAAFATDGDFDSYASIRSGTGILLGLGGQSGHLEVKFDQTVPVDKTTYIRIDYDETVLKTLLSGSLGNTVAGLVNGLLLGEHYFDVKLTNGGTNILDVSSIDSFTAGAGKVRIVQDKVGRYYIAIKAGVPYTNIRITDHTNAVLGVLAPDQFLNVYSICYDASSEICDPTFSTSYEGTGITLDLLNLGSNGVQNAEHAIDDNENTSSKINLGVLGVGASMSQFIYFNSLSPKNSSFKVRLAIESNEILNVDLLGDYEFFAYNGSTEVYRRSLAGGLLNGTNILSLLGNGDTGTLTFRPNNEFDRIEIRVNSVVAVSALGVTLQVFDVNRYGPPNSDCPDPDFVARTISNPMIRSRLKSN